MTLIDASGMPTFLHVAKMLDPNGKVAVVHEVMNQACEMLDDVVPVESNDTFSHRSTIRVGMPTAYYKSINRGTPPSTARTAQVSDPMATLQSLSQFDAQLLRGIPDAELFRWNMDKPHVQALAEEYQRALIYGNPGSNPDEIFGLFQRYNSLSAGNADAIFNCGGTSGDCTSVYVIGWSEQTVFCPYPKGGMAGIDIERLPRQLVTTDAATNRQMVAESTMFTWNHGLAIPEWEFCQRIGAIDLTDLRAGSGTQATSASTNLLKAISHAIEKIPTRHNVRMGIYGNGTVKAYLRQLANDRTQNVVTWEQGLNQFGMPRRTPVILDVPFRRVDAILNNEATIGA